MIELQDVSKIYRTAEGEVRALDNLSLQVEAGEFAAVRGPSGCGKSTLLAMVGGLAQPSRGSITVAGQQLTGMSSSELARFRAEKVGFVFQMFHLLPYLNIVDNVLVAAPPGGSAADLRGRAIELLENFGLGQRKTHLPSQLSAGERQRVAMARALLNRPNLLLADEPTGNLDPENAIALMQLVAGFHQDGGTVLLVTHEEPAASYASRTIYLHHGQLSNGAPLGEQAGTPVAGRSAGR